LIEKERHQFYSLRKRALLLSAVKGVDSQTVWNWLSDFDCDIALGFYMVKQTSSTETEARILNA